MVKKSGVKKRASKRRTTPRSSSVSKESQKILIENFVSLQKVMTRVAEKFDDLSGQISELLKLFEDSAKIVVKNEIEKSKETNEEKQILNTMVSILDQNKIIARGLTLMYETLNNVESPSSSTENTVKVVAPPKKVKIQEEPTFSPSINTASSPDYFKRG